MDIFLQGEWFEFKLPKGKILKLKLSPASFEEQLKWQESDRVGFYDLALEHVIDWEGLTEGGQKIEPTQENVKKYLQYFLTSIVERVGDSSVIPEDKESGPVADEEKPGRRMLGFFLIDILQNIENFLGN